MPFLARFRYCFRRGIVGGIGPKGIRQAPVGGRSGALSGLKMPDLKPMIAIVGDRGAFMFRRLVLILGIVAMGLALDGCTKCGPIWDDWVQSPKSCKSDRL
jgi:hypothetical protein